MQGGAFRGGAAALAILAVLAACGGPGGADLPGDLPGDAPGDVPRDLPGDLPGDVPADVAPDLPADPAPDTPVDAPVPVLPDGFAPIGGNGFVGANVPFGMIAWGPHTADGYSVTNLSGAEMAPYWHNHVPVRPTMSGPDGDPGESVGQERDGRPGYFVGQVARAGGDPIGVELTATARTGLARLSFPAGEGAGVRVGCSAWQQDAPDRISGTHLLLGGVAVHFVVQADRPFASAAETSDGVLLGLARPDGPVLLKVGMSYVDADGALANVQAEDPGWDFDAVRAAAESAWNDALSRIDVRGGDGDLRRTFYTYLYLAMQKPGLASDADGRYAGFDGAVHAVQKGHDRYTDYSIWDTYRGHVQLVSWLFPARASDMVQSLVDMAAEDASAGGGGVMPRWVVGPRESGVMETGSATPWVASAHAFGATAFDAAAAFAAMDRLESTPGLVCQGTVEHYRLDDFLALGYVPYRDDYQGKQCASFTLEYAIGDFALSRFAAALGRTADAARYEALSRNWRALFDDAAGSVRPRLPDGAWMDPFDPDAGHFQGFVEGSSAQYTWMVPHDWDWLFARMGGADAVTARLDAYFQRLNEAYNRWDSPFHCAGNEPGFWTAWAYAAAGVPSRTQQVVRRLLSEQFDVQMPGADDLGAMGAWYAWATLGFYPVLPGTDVLALHGPRFPEVVVRHADGTRTLAVTADGAGEGAPYVQALSLGGVPEARHRLPLSEILAASPATLAFTMGAEPSSWGTTASPP